MGTLRLIAALRRRRLSIALGLVLAGLIAIASVYQISLSPPGLASKETTTGFATQRLLIDTPSSLLGDANPVGGTGASYRASFLGSLVGSDPTHKAIAERMGLEGDEVAIVGSGAAVPGTLSPAATKAIEASPPRQKYVLTYAEASGLPLLSVFATAPTEGAARRLARAGLAALGQAAREGAPTTSAAKVRPIGQLSSRAKFTGPRKSRALTLAFVFLVFWLFAVLIVDRMLGARRRRRWEPVGGWPA